MIYDCHLHTEFSGDSDTPVQAQIKRAALLDEGKLPSRTTTTMTVLSARMILSVSAGVSVRVKIHKEEI